VLRITEQKSEDGMVLHLEGRLVGPWVEQLGGLCQELLDRNMKVALDLKSVGFADERGVILLRDLARTVRLENCSSFLAQQIQIQVEKTSWLR
jgi:ABC-type transporter Mla MlaB component